VLTLSEYKQRLPKNQGVSEKKSATDLLLTFWHFTVTRQQTCFTGLVPLSITKAVKREEGVTPSLSRNCKGVPTPLNATGDTWEGAEEGKYPSQETCHTDAVLDPPWNEGPEPECINTHDFEPLPTLDRGFFVSS
jgi:hypothetical protein